MCFSLEGVLEFYLGEGLGWAWGVTRWGGFLVGWIDGPREGGREGGVDGCFLRSDGLAFLRDAIVCGSVLLCSGLVGWLVCWEEYHDAGCSD